MARRKKTSPVDRLEKRKGDTKHSRLPKKKTRPFLRRGRDVPRGKEEKKVRFAHTPRKKKGKKKNQKLKRGESMKRGMGEGQPIREKKGSSGKRPGGEKKVYSHGRLNRRREEKEA